MMILARFIKSVNYVVVIKGPRDEYLGCRVYGTRKEADKFVEDHGYLMIANIEDEMSLKERLKLAPEYFTFAGRVHDMEVEPVDLKTGKPKYD